MGIALNTTWIIAESPIGNTQMGEGGMNGWFTKFKIIFINYNKLLLLQ